MGSGVQSFAVGDSGQNVYWLNTGGTLNESINGGPGCFGAGAGTWLDGAVQSFALANNPVGIVDLTENRHPSEKDTAAPSWAPACSRSPSATAAKTSTG